MSAKLTTQRKWLFVYGNVNLQVLKSSLECDVFFLLWLSYGSWCMAWNGDIGFQGWQSGHSLHSQTWRGSPSCKFTWASPLYLMSILAHCVILHILSFMDIIVHGYWIICSVFIPICTWISLTFSTFLLQPPSVTPLPTPIKETTNAAA